MAKHDGGQVFPIPVGPEGPAFLGMTRRQLYGGMIAAQYFPARILECETPTDEQWVAAACWRMADALLATEEE